MFSSAAKLNDRISFRSSESKDYFFMKRSLLKILPAFVLCLSGLGVSANDIEPGKDAYSVIRAPKTIVLDGDLSEWTGVPVLADPKFAVPKYSGTNASPNYVLFEQYGGGTWSGPDDQTSAVQIAYDEENVYFGFVVTDDYHENISGGAWNGDSIQLMIADATRTQQVALYNYALLGYEDKQGQYVPDPAQPEPVLVHHEAGPGGTEAVIKRDSVKKKTTYEIKLPKASLGLESLKGGPKFGLGMAINDGDGALVDGVQYGQAGQEGQKGWGGLGAHSIVFGKTPAETALVTLTKGNDIEPSKEYYTALKTTKTIVLDGNLSDWAGLPVLADPKFAVPKYSGTNASPNYVLFEQYGGGTWSGPDDQTSAVQVAYDDNNVYFGFVVTDDYHENVSGGAWNGDSIQLMIADATRTQQVALYNYALLGYENAQKVFVPDPAQEDPMLEHHEAGPGGTESFIKRDSVNKKTIYEIKLPVESLGLTAPLTAGTKFGLGMAINDGDGALVDGVQYGQAGQEGQKGWGGLGAHSIVFGKTPSETALVTLGTAVSGSDTLFLSAINPAYNKFTFRATDKGSSIVNPATTTLSIDGKSVTLTSLKTGDATDFTYTPASVFALGSTHTYSIVVKDTLGTSVRDEGTFKIPTLKIGLNFGADEPVLAEVPGTAVPVTEVAGVPAVAQAHWNNLTLATGSVTPASNIPGNAIPGVLTDTGEATLITVTWDSAGTWASTGDGEENNKFTGNNKILMTGYLDTTESSTTTVKIEGISDLLVSNGYDVYVYALGGVAGRGGGYRIVDSTGKVLKGYVLATSDTNPSAFKEVPQNLASGVAGSGNYIVFSALHAASITIEATTVAPQGKGSVPRAPVNAVQLVPTPQLAPPALSIKKTTAGVEITFEGTLQSSSTVNGTYTDVSGANSPYATPASGTAKYYRARR